MKGIFLPRILKTIIEGPPPSRHAVTLTHRNIFVVPSKRGLLFLSSLLVLLFLGLNYRNNMVLLFCFLLGSCALVSIIYSFLQLYGLKVEPGVGEEVFAGEVACFEIFIHEYMGRIRFLEIVAGEEEVFWKIYPWKRNQVFFKIKTEKRGRILYPRFECISRYPLGLFRTWSVFRFYQETIVYPKPLPPPREKFTPIFQEIEGGEGKEGRGTSELIYLDEYGAFDSYKKIYWRLYARDDRLVKKVFVGDGTPVIWFSLNMFREYPLEEALGFLCYLIRKAEGSFLIEYGLELDGERVLPSRGEAHMRSCLRCLALYGL